MLQGQSKIRSFITWWRSSSGIFFPRQMMLLPLTFSHPKPLNFSHVHGHGHMEGRWNISICRFMKYKLLKCCSSKCTFILHIQKNQYDIFTCICNYVQWSRNLYVALIFENFTKIRCDKWFNHSTYATLTLSAQ